MWDEKPGITVSLEKTLLPSQFQFLSTSRSKCRERQSTVIYVCKGHERVIAPRCGIWSGKYTSVMPGHSLPPSIATRYQLITCQLGKRRRWEKRRCRIQSWNRRWRRRRTKDLRFASTPLPSPRNRSSTTSLTRRCGDRQGSVGENVHELEYIATTEHDAPDVD